MTQSSARFSIIVVGGGMIGLSAALALRQQGHQVALIEQAERPQFGATPELRVSALAHHSRHLLQQLGVWQQLPQHRLGPYTGMQVWDHDSFGAIEFAATEVGAEDLGAIVENLVLEQTLWDCALAAGVVIHTHSTVTAQHVDSHSVQVTLASGQQLQADFLIAADGSRSSIRERAKLPLTFWDYQQTGTVAVIATEKPHQGIARQVFLPTGPIAWLPLHDPHLVSLVWSADLPLAQQLQQLDDTRFIQRLQAASDSCLGQLSLQSQRAGFPLRMQYAQRWLQHRLILIGDAAHSIHPLAGQGANLGFGDVIDLVATFAQGAEPRQLRQWERSRKAAATLMIASMEAFKRGFGSANPGLKLIRGLGFKLADSHGPLKRALVQTALGDRFVDKG